MDKGVPVRLRIECQVSGQLLEEVTVKSDVPQGSIIGPLLFLAYGNDFWLAIESTVRLIPDGCVIYRKIISNEGGKVAESLDRLRKWAVENTMKINSSKCKAVRFTTARVKFHSIFGECTH